MKLLLDEPFAKDVAQRLRWRGYDVEAIQERPDVAGRPDDEVFLFHVAGGERRSLVTGSAEQFARIVGWAAQEGIDHAGVVFVTTERLPPGPAASDGLVEALGELLRRQPAGALANAVRWVP